MAVDFSEVLNEVKKGNAEQAIRDADALKKQEIADSKALKSYSDGQKRFEEKFLSGQDKAIEEEKKAKEAFEDAKKKIDMRTKEGKQLKEQHEQTIAQLNQDLVTNQLSLEEDQALAQEQEVQRLEDIKYREEERKKKDEQEQTAAGQLKLRGEELDLIKKDIEERGVSAENVEEYFEDFKDDPYMLYVGKFKEGKQLASIAHKDDTCRIQTVKQDTGSFRLLLEEFYKLTGCPILLNTSLNLAGKPIAGHPNNVYELFKNSTLDCFVIGDDYAVK